VDNGPQTFAARRAEERGVQEVEQGPQGLQRRGRFCYASTYILYEASKKRRPPTEEDPRSPGYREDHEGPAMLIPWSPSSSTRKPGQGRQDARRPVPRRQRKSVCGEYRVDGPVWPMPRWRTGSKGRTQCRIIEAAVDVCSWAALRSSREPQPHLRRGEDRQFCPRASLWSPSSPSTGYSSCSRSILPFGLYRRLFPLFSAMRSSVSSSNPS